MIFGGERRLLRYARNDKFGYIAKVVLAGAALAKLDFEKLFL